MIKVGGIRKIMVLWQAVFLKSHSTILQRLRRQCYPCHWIAFLSYDVKSSSSTLKARLHSPVDKITPIGKNLRASNIDGADGIIFLTSDGGPIKAISFADGAINILPKPRKKDDFISLANRLQLPTSGNVAELKERLNRYSVSFKARYT